MYISLNYVTKLIKLGSDKNQFIELMVRSFKLSFVNQHIIYQFISGINNLNEMLFLTLLH